MKIQALGTGIVVEAIVKVSTIADVNGGYKVLREEGDSYAHYRVKVLSIGEEVTEIKIGDYVRIPFETLERRMIHQSGDMVTAVIDKREVVYKEVQKGEVAPK